MKKSALLGCLELPGSLAQDEEDNGHGSCSSSLLQPPTAELEQPDSDYQFSQSRLSFMESFISTETELPQSVTKLAW